jgi:hypothetical protein
VKNILPFLVGLLAIVAGAGYLISSTQTRAERAEFDAALHAARVDTARQVPILIQSPDDKIGYDRQQFMRKHLDALEPLQKKPEYANYIKEDAFILDMEEKAKKGEKDKARTAEYRQRFDYVKQVWDSQLKEGAYKPVLSGYQNGFRMDITSMKQANEAGQQGIRMDAIIWGAVKEQITFSTIELQSVIELDEKETSGKRKGEPKQGIVKINGAGPPYIYVDEPWKWVPAWPPGVSVGYYVGLPLFHPTAAKFTLTMTFQLRSQGGTVTPVELVWKDIPVDPALRGAPGSPWDADVGEASDEELKEAGIPVE